MTNTILIVDDSMMIRRIVGQLLKECGYQVLLAEDGQQGCESARQNQPDLVLMDIEMPGMDGITATRQLKTDPATRHIPVIIFSSLSSEEDMDQARAAGCDGFVNKPICKQEIQSSINAIFGNGN